MLEGATKVVASSLEIGTSDWGGRVFEGGGVTAGALVCVAELVMGICDADVLVDATGALVGRVDSVSDVGMVGSLDGKGVLVPAVMPVPVEICEPLPVEADGVTPVSVGAEDVKEPVGKGLVVTPVPLTEPEGVIPEVVTAPVGLDVGNPVEIVGDVSDVGMTNVPEVAVGREVRIPVPVGRREVSVGSKVERMPVPVGRPVVSVGSDRTLDTPEMMLEMTLETSGRDRVSLGTSVGSDVGMAVPVGAVGPTVESETPETVVGRAPVDVGAVGFKTDVTSETTEESTDETSDPTEERSDETPGRRSVSLAVSEVGMAAEVVTTGVTVALVAPVPNAVVMPTTMPLVGRVKGMLDEKLMSLEGSTTLLGTPPTEPVG